MKKKIKSSLIILTWNEIEAVRELYRKIPFGIFDECFVVDGGSTDGTIEFFLKRNIPVYIQDKPGHGEAYKYGLKKAKGEVIVYFSGDGNENPEDLPRMLKEIRNGKDLVIASRFDKESKTFDAGLGRQFGNRLFTFLVNFFWGAKITDVFNAFRAVRRESMKKLKLKSSGFDTELEMVVKAVKKGYKIGEFPTVEMKRIGGEAKLQTWRDGRVNLMRVVKELGLISWVEKNWQTMVLGVIVLAAVVMRMHYINIYPEDRDELARTVPELTLISKNSPGFLALIKIFGHLFNYSDFGYRLPSLVFAILGIVAIYYLGKAVLSKTVGVLAALVLSVSLTHIGYANQAKDYTAMMFFGILLTLFSYQIVFAKIHKGLYWFLYLITIPLSFLFGNYFCFLLICYQMAIIFVVEVVRNFVKVKELFNLKGSSLSKLFLIVFALVFLIVLAIISFRAINGYFGLYFIFPTPIALRDYYYGLGYYFVQDLPYTQVLNFWILVSVVVALFFFRRWRGYLFLALIVLLDVLLVGTMRFKHSAFPLFYPRYHSFLAASYFVLVSGAVTVLGLSAIELIFKGFDYLKIKYKGLNRRYIEVVILSLGTIVFVVFVFRRTVPMLTWYYGGVLSFVKTDFKDAGKYLSFNLLSGDTLVRLKNFGMDHKFNHVNRYIRPDVFSRINYSIFPRRTSLNNWYVPLGSGDEDLHQFEFDGWLVTQKIRPGLVAYAPYVEKLSYYGPLTVTRKIEDRSSWKASSTVKGTVDTSVVFDGDIKTVWGGPINTGDYFFLDLSKSYLINAINFNFAQYGPQNFKIRLSQDGVSWKTVFVLATPGFNPHNPGKIYFEPVLARYVVVDFMLDPLTVIKDVGISEVEVYEVYEKNIGVDKDLVFDSESVVRYDFSKNIGNFLGNERVEGLRVENGELRGRVINQGEKRGEVKINFSSNLKGVNFINYSLKVDRGASSYLVLKTKSGDIRLDGLGLKADGVFHRYSVSLDEFRVPLEMREISALVFVPSDASEANFEIDYISLDVRNLSGIQVQDSFSPNGFSRFVPYDPLINYYFFQIGNEMVLEKGEYVAHFKIRADKIDLLWKDKLPPAPEYRLYEYLEPPEASPNDILCVSIESTKGTFYDSPAYLYIRGEVFKEANKYYEFEMPFKTDGKEKLFFQAYSSKDRRYPANLYVTYPEIERVK